MFVTCVCVCVCFFWVIIKIGLHGHPCSYLTNQACRRVKQACTPIKPSVKERGSWPPSHGPSATTLLHRLAALNVFIDNLGLQLIWIALLCAKVSWLGFSTIHFDCPVADPQPCLLHAIVLISVPLPTPSVLADGLLSVQYRSRPSVGIWVP